MRMDEMSGIYNRLPREQQRKVSQLIDEAYRKREPGLTSLDICRRAIEQVLEEN